MIQNHYQEGLDDELVRTMQAVRRIMDVIKDSMVQVHAIVRRNILLCGLKDVDHFR